MGQVKNWLFELEAERHAKQEALLDAPKLIEQSNRFIERLQSELEKSTETVDDLRRQVALASSWRSKATDYFVGGLIGALIGLLF